MQDATARYVEELETLTHRERMRRMVNVGRSVAAGDAAARALVDDLWSSGRTYERTLALQSAYGSRDGALVGADRSRRFFGAVTAPISAEAAEEAQHATRATLQRMTADEVDAVVAVFEPVLATRRNAAVMLEAIRPRHHEAEHRRTVAQHVLDRALGDVRATAIALDFAAYVLDPPHLGKLLRRLDAEARLDFDAIAAALRAIDQSASPQHIEDLLRPSPSALLRRCALHALVAESRARGWSRDRRDRLETYRADPAIVVASAAEWIFPPPLKVPTA